MTGWLQQAAITRDTVSVDSVVVESPLPGGAAAVARFLFSTVPQWVQIAGVFVGAIVALVVLVVLWRRRLDLVRWFSARSRGWKLGFAAVTLAVLGGVGFAGAKSWNFMMHDNDFCTGCHVMEQPFRRFTASEHSQLSCHDCHQQGMTANVRQLYQWVAERPEDIGAHAPVPNRICAECHVQSDPDSTWQRISATAGHAVHLNPRSPAMRAMECVTCHGEEVHRFKPASETCAQSGCHENLRIELGAMAAQTSLHCSTCHTFTAPAVETNPTDSARAALVPREEQCFECHQMRERLAEFRPENEPHGAVCGTCHNPHTQTTPSGAFQSCATSTCHARADTLTPLHRGLRQHRLETCGACHSAHTWRTGGTNCRDCHTGITDPAVRVRPPSPQGAQAPVPAGRGTHVRPVAGLAPASWSGTRQAAAAHVPHAVGRGRWRRSGRSDALNAARHVALTGASPRQQAPPAREPPRQQRDTTRFEHQRHESVSCTTCHTTTDQHGGLRRAARQCSSCHHGNTALGRACERCHQSGELATPYRMATPMALTVWPAPRTRQLDFAHAQHAPLACAECHAATITRGVERTCASCHAQHHEAARSCASCHPPSRQTHTRAVHETGCGGAGCHTSETTAAITPVRAVCVACHDGQAAHKPGGDCATCHLSAWRPGAGRSSG
ncbi:MAG TPA: NapC/NirT family cytochrome c [Gemmatimonadaceae bacterium]|nr:NapC/NirT family cytochrome c [Gemmatimonadaceae bacterium]